jgi:SOS response regulatory protein OraA/RecX
MTIERQEPTAYDQSVTILSRKALSTLELTQKLENTGFSPEVIGPLLHTLKGHGYLNDEALGLKIYQDSVRQRKGPLWIAQKLEKRRLSQAVIDHFSDLGQENALEHARELLTSRFAPSDFPDHAGRAFRFLVSRGYPASVAEAALQEVLP